MILVAGRQVVLVRNVGGSRPANRIPFYGLLLQERLFDQVKEKKLIFFLFFLAKNTKQTEKLAFVLGVLVKEAFLYSAFFNSHLTSPCKPMKHLCYALLVGNTVVFALSPVYNEERGFSLFFSEIVLRHRKKNILCWMREKILL